MNAIIRRGAVGRRSEKRGRKLQNLIGPAGDTRQTRAIPYRLLVDITLMTSFLRRWPR